MTVVTRGVSSEECYSPRVMQLRHGDWVIKAGCHRGDTLTQVIIIIITTTTTTTTTTRAWWVACWILMLTGSKWGPGISVGSTLIGTSRGKVGDSGGGVAFIHSFIH